MAKESKVERLGRENKARDKELAQGPDGVKARLMKRANEADTVKKMRELVKLMIQAGNWKNIQF